MLDNHNNPEEFIHRGWDCALMPDGKRYLCSRNGQFVVISYKEELR